MKRFVIRLSVFCVILFLLCSPFIYACVISDELADFDTLIAKQHGSQDNLIGMAYNEQTAYLKITNVNYYKPDVIALGTSRVMQFRKEFFSASFYNCGGSLVSSYDQYLNFLKNMEYQPKIVIIGLDFWLWNADFSGILNAYPEYYKIGLDSRDKTAVVQSLFDAWISRKWSFSSLHSFPGNTGLSGKVKNSGYAADGSYYYGSKYVHPETDEERCRDVYNRIVSGTNMFEYGENLNSKAQPLLENLLEYCKTNDMEVIGFIPPVADSVYRMIEDSGKYSYLKKMDEACRKSFEKYGYAYFNFSNPAEFGADDSFFIDGYHGGDIIYAMFALDMADKSALSGYVDKENLTCLIENRQSNLVL